MRIFILILSQISFILEKCRRKLIGARDHPSSWVKIFYLFYRLRFPLLFFLLAAGLYFSKINLTLGILPKSQNLSYLILLQFVWLSSGLNRALNEWLRRQYASELHMDASPAVSRSGSSYLQVSVFLNSGFFICAFLFLALMPLSEEGGLAVSIFYLVEILGVCVLGTTLSYYSLAAAKRRPWFDSFEIFAPRVLELLLITIFFESLGIWSLVMASLMTLSLNTIIIGKAAQALNPKFHWYRLEWKAIRVKFHALNAYVKPRFVFLLSIHLAAIFNLVMINQISSIWALIFAFSLLLGQVVSMPTSRIGKTLYFDIQRALVRCEFYRASKLFNFSVVASMFSMVMSFGLCYLLWLIGFLHFGFNSMVGFLNPAEFLLASILASIIAIRSSLNASVPLVDLAPSSVYQMSGLYGLGLVLMGLLLVFEPVELEHLIMLWMAIELGVLGVLAWRLLRQKEKDYQFSPWLTQQDLYGDSRFLLSLGRDDYRESSHLKVCRGANAFFNYLSLWFEMRRRLPEMQGVLVMIKWRRDLQRERNYNENRKGFVNSFRRTDIIWELPNKNLFIFLTGSSKINLNTFADRMLKPILSEIEIAKRFEISDDEHQLQAFIDRAFDRFPPRYLLMNKSVASCQSYSSLNQKELNEKLMDRNDLHPIEKPIIFELLGKEALGLRPWLETSVLKKSKIIPLIAGRQIFGLLDARALCSKDEKAFEDLFYSSMEAFVRACSLNVERSEDKDKFWREVFEHRHDLQIDIVTPLKCI